MALDGLITLPEVSLALVLANLPDSGEFHFFVDTNGKVAKYVDSLGAVSVLGPGVANSLVTADTPNPFIVDGSTPVAKQVLIADSPVLGTWGYIPGYLTLDPTVELASFNLVGRVMKVCNVVPGSLVATLPLANSLPVDTVCGVKLEREAGGNILTINAQGGNTLDNFTVPKVTTTLTLDAAWAYFKTDGTSIWYGI